MGLGKIGQGEIAFVEATVESSYVQEPKNGTGAQQWVIENVDAIGYEKDAEVGTPYSTSRQNPGAFKTVYFVDPARDAKFRAARAFFNHALDKDEIEPEEIANLRVRYQLKTRSGSDFPDYIPVKVVASATPVEAYTEEQVIDALRGKAPAEAAGLSTTPGIRGTKWAATVVNKKAVEKLGLTVDATGKYA